MEIHQQVLVQTYHQDHQYHVVVPVYVQVVKFQPLQIHVHVQLVQYQPELIDHAYVQTVALILVQHVAHYHMLLIQHIIL